MADPNVFLGRAARENDPTAINWKSFSDQAPAYPELEPMVAKTKPQDAKQGSKPALAKVPAHKVFPPKRRRMSKKQLARAMKPITLLTTR